MSNQNARCDIPEHQIQGPPLSVDDLVRVWDEKTDTGGAIIARDPEGLLGVRTNCASLTIVAAFYSPLHRRTIQKALKLFSRRQSITQAALDDARAKAAAMYRECCEPAVISSVSANRLKAHERATLRKLADIYFDGDHFTGLKNGKTRDCRKSQIERLFLEYAPTVKERAKQKFADRQLVRAPLNEDDLDAWKADTLARYEGRPHQVNRTASYVASMFKWLAANHYLPASAVPKLPTAPESPTHYARDVTLDAAMMRALWRASETLPAHERAFVQLLILTGQRRDIIAKLQWSEVRLQEEVPHFLFKHTRSKNSRAYMLPITPQILDVLQSVPSFETFDYVVAVPSNDGRPLSRFSYVKSKLETVMRKELGAKYCDWRFHDLRRNAKSGMAMLGINGRVSELCLAHSPNWETKVEPHYNIHSYVPEKADAMRRYNDLIMRTVFPERYSAEDHAKADVTAKLAKLPPDKIAAILAILG